MWGVSVRTYSHTLAYPPLQLVLRGRAVLDPGPSGGRVRGVAEQLPRFLRNFAEDQAADRADRREPQLERSVRRASEDLAVDRA